MVRRPEAASATSRNGKPGATQGRKTSGLQKEIAGPPNEELYMAHRCVFWLATAAFALSACSQGPSYRTMGSQISFSHRDLGNIDPTAPGFADGLLGHRTSSSRDVGPMPRWQRVMARFSEQEHSPASACSGSEGASCPSEIWKRLVDELKTLPLRARVEKVNEVFNRVPYVAAEVNWHDVAYWETPYEFLERGGQCQDYAIAKYLALLKSGVPEQIFVLWSCMTIRRSSIMRLPWSMLTVFRLRSIIK